MAHHYSGDRNDLACGTAQVEPMLLQIPQQRSPNRSSQNQTGRGQTRRLRHDKTNHLNRTHSEGHQHAQFTGALKDRHQHGVHDANDRQQEKNKKKHKRDAVIELHVIGQVRRQLGPRTHLNGKDLTQSNLKCRGHRRRLGYVVELNTNFMDPSRRQLQKVL